MIGKKLILFLILIAFSILVFLILKPKNNFTLPVVEETEKTDCVTETKEETVRGNSLSGLIENGEEVKIFFGYYNCHEVNRGDIVIYNYAGSKNPLIKIVKGIPQDKFGLRKSADGNGWNILINDKILENSQGKLFVLNESAYKILSIYERDYNGIIPEESYLIMGNLYSGSIDSSFFGLAAKSDILGKAEK